MDVSQLRVVVRVESLEEIVDAFKAALEVLVRIGRKPADGEGALQTELELSPVAVRVS
jgi:hypothetical protein